MNKKGFTLLELIAVIVILAVILLITMPNIMTIFDSTRSKLNDNQKSQILSAARTWGMAHLNSAKTEDQKTSISIKTLKEQGYLDDKEITDMVKKNNIEDTVICVSYENNQYVYTYEGAKTCTN